jgi:4-hydroxybenzoate polyprenyltransferase
VTTRGGPGIGGVPELLRLARPRQWIKNAVVFAALVFADRLRDPEAAVLAVVTFVAFCCASSAVYILNDLRDRDEDRAHPVKRRRPLAAGLVSPRAAAIEGVVLAIATFALGALLPLRATLVLGAYLLLNLAYTLWLKQMAIVDVLSIALGFVLRVQAGIEAIGSPQSAWILLTMFFVALCLASGKRRSELAQLAGQEGRRVVLGTYSLGFLDLLLGVSATTALMCYALYAVTVHREETFVVTVLPVTFGILRYLLLVVVRERGEDPDELITRDRPLALAIVLWAALSVAVLYLDLRLFGETTLGR